MWGNRLGWALSAALVAVVGALILLIQMATAISPPTELTRNAENLRAIQLPIDPESIVPASRPSNAGILYRRVIDAVHQDLDAFLTPTKAEGRERIKPAMDLLIEAAGCGSMSLFADRPQELIRYDHPGNRREALEALLQAGRAAVQIGLAYRIEHKADEARRHLEAAFALGEKLFRERLVFDEAQAGYELMISASLALAKLEEESGNGARAAQIQSFADQTRSYFDQRVRPIWEAVSSIDPAVSQQHAGDVFVLAVRSEERMWRVEAAMKLGLLRRMSSRAGDQRGAGRVLKEIAEDPKEDPIVRSASVLGRDLSLEEFRMLGG